MTRKCINALKGEVLKRKMVPVIVLYFQSVYLVYYKLMLMLMANELNQRINPFV